MITNDYRHFIGPWVSLPFGMMYSFIVYIIPIDQWIEMVFLRLPHRIPFSNPPILPDTFSQIDPFIESLVDHITPTHRSSKLLSATVSPGLKSKSTLSG